VRAVKKKEGALQARITREEEGWEKGMYQISYKIDGLGSVRNKKKKKKK